MQPVIQISLVLFESFYVYMNWEYGDIKQKKKKKKKTQQLWFVALQYDSDI